MNWRIRLLGRVPARFVGARVLDRLSAAAADAFGVPAPAWRSLALAERLTAFAEFTAAQATEAAQRQGGEARALYRNAHTLGATVRRQLAVRYPQEAMEALTLLYRSIGIAVTGRPAGVAASPGVVAEIEITRCFFAPYYSEPVCRMMAAMDAGVVDGLFGGASLEFSSRLTSGSPCCRASIRFAEARS